MKPHHVILLFIAKLVANYQILSSPSSSVSEVFPYHAVIEAEDWWCNGVIISECFVLTRASCLIKDKEPMVYLGFTRNPYVSRNLMDAAGQAFHAEKIFIHEEFGSISASKQFINNLALIQLHKSIVPSPTVKPIEIASPDDYPIPAGTYLNVTGFLDFQEDGNIQYSTVQLRHLEECSLFFGSSFLKSEELCVKCQGPKRIKWAGPYIVNGVLVGLQRSLHSGAACHVSSPPCDVHDVFISLENHLEWIYRVAKVAAKNGKEYFAHDNPYWQHRPEKIEKQAIKNIEDNVIDLQVNIDTCKANENHFIAALQHAIEKNLREGLKTVMFTIDLV